MTQAQSLFAQSVNSKSTMPFSASSRTVGLQAQHVFISSIAYLPTLMKLSQNTQFSKLFCDYHNDTNILQFICIQLKVQLLKKRIEIVKYQLLRHFSDLLDFLSYLMQPPIPLKNFYNSNRNFSHNFVYFAQKYGFPAYFEYSYCKFVALYESCCQLQLISSIPVARSNSWFEHCRSCLAFACPFL